MEQDLSQRVAILRYLLIFGIVVLHTPPYVPLGETGPGVFDFIKALFQHAVFRASVPVLTFISGYLLFSSGLDGNWPRLLSKKTRTILLPLVFFNLPFVLFLYLTQWHSLIDHEFSRQVYPFDWIAWINGTIGLLESPVNYPLNFLRDLYLISIGAPIIGLLIRHTPWLGFLGIFSVFWFNLDGPLVLRNTMPIVFYLGAVAALHNWKMNGLDKFAWLLLGLFIVLCVATVQFEIANRNYLRVVSPVLIWPAAALLVNTRVGLWLSEISGCSFITFLMHAPLLFLAWVGYSKVANVVPYWLFWIATPVAVAAILALVRDLGSRIFPRTTRLALGGR